MTLHVRRHHTNDPEDLYNYQLSNYRFSRGAAAARWSSGRARNDLAVGTDEVALPRNR